MNNDDLISREAVLAALRARDRELLNLGTSFEAKIASVATLQCVNIVKAAPAVDAEPVPKWISVEERLPEKSDKYIVCTAKGSVYCTRFKAYAKSGSFQTDINTHITHWMPLPEPPEGGDG